jgi:acetylornithine aminotransferase/acetylornithine/N-succinyldiaminopimelate aminotransferase
VPYNDLEAVRTAISPATAAILIEGVQGEGGVTPATPEYLLGLRRLCDERKLLLLMDAVQDGHFRTGRVQIFQRILENTTGAEGFLPDGISMAKALGGGFPIGAFWVREPFADLLGPGTHASTFGGTPLACAVALKILAVVRRDALDANARRAGERLLEELRAMAGRYPGVIQAVRGLGLMIGIELEQHIPALAADQKAPALQLVNRLHLEGLLTVPAGAQVIRLLPALNVQGSETEEALAIFERVLRRLARQGAPSAPSPA